MTAAKNAKQEYTKNSYRKKTPYSKILLRQTAAAVICFFVLKYLCAANIISDFDKKLKSMINESASFETAIKSINEADLKSFFANAAGKFFENGKDKFENEKDKFENGEDKNEDKKDQRKTNYVLQ